MISSKQMLKEDTSSAQLISADKWPIENNELTEAELFIKTIIK